MFLKFLRTCAYIFYSLFVCLILIEVTLQFFPGLLGVQSRKELFQEGDFYWRLKPDLDTSVAGQCWKSHVKTNSIGTRGLPYEELKAKREAWYFVGDSLVQGLEVDNEDLFTMHLQNRIPDAAVINIAKSGAGPFEYTGFLRWHLKEALHPNPRRVFYFVYLGNDLENLVDKEWRPFKEEIRKEKKDRNFFTKLDTFIVSQSKYLKTPLVYERIKAWLLFVIGGSSSGVDVEMRFLQSELFLLAKIRLREAFSELKDLAREYKVDVAVVLIPSVAELEGGREHPVYSLPVDVVSTAAGEFQLPVFNLAEHMIDYARAQNLQYPYFSFMCDGHFSPFGHRIVSDLLWEKLVAPS